MSRSRRAAVAVAAICLIGTVAACSAAPAEGGRRLAARAVGESPTGAPPSAAPAATAPTRTASRATPRPARPHVQHRTATIAGTSTHRSEPAARSPARRVSAVRPAPVRRASPHHIAPATSGYPASSIAYSVLAQLNAQRHSVGVAPLRMNGMLTSSAHRHNLAMAAANTMSHQLPGEAYFADRIRAAGYDYRYAGENIAWSSTVSTGGALALGTTMFGEGPGGEHWHNITDRHFVDVGVDVYIDTNRVLWLTEDFGCQ